MGLSCNICKNKSCFVLNYFSPEDIDLISENKSIKHYKKNELVYCEGEIPSNIYFIYEGCLKISKKHTAQDALDLYYTEPGDLVGYRSVICSEPHSTSAYFYTDSLVCEVHKDYFLDSFNNKKDFIEKFMKFLSEAVWQRERRIEDLENYKNN